MAMAEKDGPPIVYDWKTNRHVWVPNWYVMFRDECMHQRKPQIDGKSMSKVMNSNWIRM